VVKDFGFNIILLAQINYCPRNVAYLKVFLFFFDYILNEGFVSCVARHILFALYICFCDFILLCICCSWRCSLFPQPFIPASARIMTKSKSFYWLKRKA